MRERCYRKERRADESIIYFIHLVISTDENLVIARHVVEVLSGAD
ncbi:MAG TPA: hypothetical protein VKE42_05675 [Candidatus Cybelea sp.]|nr:hypothetical protein [Candidatus Cybelea sp.]